MHQYYIPNKNRCKIACTPGYIYPFFICKSTIASIYTQNKKSSAVAFSNQNKEFTNIEKRGSGGNSYDAYLANKKGKMINNKKCNINQQNCWSECHPTSTQ